MIPLLCLEGQRNSSGYLESPTRGEILPTVTDIQNREPVPENVHKQPVLREKAPSLVPPSLSFEPTP